METVQLLVQPKNFLSITFYSEAYDCCFGYLHMSERAGGRTELLGNFLKIRNKNRCRFRLRGILFMTGLA